MRRAGWVSRVAKLYLEGRLRGVLGGLEGLSAIPRDEMSSGADGAGIERRSVGVPGG